MPKKSKSSVASPSQTDNVFVDSDDFRAIASSVATKSNKRIKDNTLQATNDMTNEHSFGYS